MVRPAEWLLGFWGPDSLAWLGVALGIVCRPLGLLGSGLGVGQREVSFLGLEWF
jgi:hypothetical protein